MDLTTPIAEPGTTELRKFAAIMAVMVALFFGLLLPFIWDAHWPVWPWLVSGVCALLALVWPRGMRPGYRVWMRFGQIMGWINSRIILAVVFYAIVTPMGWIMRALGNDPLDRRLEPETQSYRQTSRKPEPDHLKRPY